MGVIAGGDVASAMPAGHVSWLKSVGLVAPGVEVNPATLSISRKAETTSCCVVGSKGGCSSYN